MRADSRVVLDDFSLQVARGESIAVMGRNGAGKSTLLALIAGVIRPTSGTLAVNGRVSPLLELGAGFHPELTGRDNVMLNGVLLGLAARRGRGANGQHRGLRGTRGLDRRAGADLFHRHDRATRIFRGGASRSGNPADRRSAGGRRHGVPGQVHREDPRIPPPRRHHRLRLPRTAARTRALRSRRRGGRPSVPPSSATCRLRSRITPHCKPGRTDRGKCAASDRNQRDAAACARRRAFSRTESASTRASWRRRTRCVVT